MRARMVEMSIEGDNFVKITPRAVEMSTSIESGQ